MTKSVRVVIAADDISEPEAVLGALAILETEADEVLGLACGTQAPGWLAGRDPASWIVFEKQTDDKGLTECAGAWLRKEFSEAGRLLPVVVVAEQRSLFELARQVRGGLGAPFCCLGTDKSPYMYVSECTVRVLLSASEQDLRDQFGKFLGQTPIIRKKQARSKSLPTESQRIVGDGVEEQKKEQKKILDIFLKSIAANKAISMNLLEPYGIREDLFVKLDLMNDMFYEQYQLVPSVLLLKRSNVYAAHFFAQLRIRWHKCMLNKALYRDKFVAIETRKLSCLIKYDLKISSTS